MTQQPIVPTDTRTLYQGRIFSVQIETLPMPNGRPMRAEIVRHPGSVVIVPIMASGDIVLVRQYRPAIGRWAWELPAGSLGAGEDVQGAAIRECHEEISLIPSIVECLGAFYPTPGYCDERMTFFKASGLRPPGPDEVAHRDEDEDIEARAFSPDALRRMVATGEIADLKTVAGLSLLAY